MKIKIIGAGSIGNHLAQASRRMGWDVVVVDKDPEALRRTKEDIYPKRYGAWDESIQLFTSEKEPKGGFDIIAIGTPPDIRMKLALASLAEKPKVLQLEKPLCTPSLEGLKEFLDAYKKQKETVAVVGYDHAVAESIEFVLDLLKQNVIGEVETLDVEFREHWQGIFSAHSWLSGPADTYLGYWRRGGGASGEHSHALHLWQLLAGWAGLGKWRNVAAVMEIRKENGAEYDAVATFNLVTDKGRVGRVVQDVITLPTKKWARLQGKSGFIEWLANGDPKGDIVRYQKGNDAAIEKLFEKKRPDDFYRETLHIQDLFDKKISPEASPISLESAVEVMKVLNVAQATRDMAPMIQK